MNWHETKSVFTHRVLIVISDLEPNGHKTTQFYSSFNAFHSLILQTSYLVFIKAVGDVKQQCPSVVATVNHFIPLCMNEAVLLWLVNEPSQSYIQPLLQWQLWIQEVILFPGSCRQNAGQVSVKIPAELTGDLFTRNYETWSQKKMSLSVFLCWMSQCASV